jgi:hypothetical protein
MERKELIDVETSDRDFDELMIQEYPGQLFEKNRMIRYAQGKKVYCFYGLDKRDFDRFLQEQEKSKKLDYKTRRFLGFPNESCELEGLSMN